MYKRQALVTIDVKSLYTNIDTKLGLASVADAMELNPDPSDPEVLKLLEICLSNNTFAFGDSYYCQCNGCAMGHSYCCHYANIFLAGWEKGALAKCKFLPIFYVRFLDDIFLIWCHGKAEFIRFFEIFNNHFACIKLTYTYDLLSINFLDVTIYKGPSFKDSHILDTKLFFKPTDSHQLLHSKSYHPPHIFRNVVKSQVIRFARICNNLDDYDAACSTLFSALKHRGYSKRSLRRIKSEIRSRYFDSPHINMISKPQSQPCNGPRCSLCPLILICNSVSINNAHFEIRSNLNCDSVNVIYVIHCIKCNVYYVGETSTPLRTRLNQHLSSIRTGKNYPVAIHFNSSEHNINSDFRISPIIQVPNTKYRKFLESSLIKSFGTESPRGMNLREDDIAKLNAVSPIVIEYSPTTVLFNSKIKNLAQEHKVSKKKFISAFSRHKNLGNHLACTK